MTKTIKTLTPFDQIKKGDRVRVIVEGVVNDKWNKRDHHMADEFQLAGIGNANNYIRPDKNTIIEVLTELPDLEPGMILRGKATGSLRIVLGDAYRTGTVNLHDMNGSLTIKDMQSTPTVFRDFEIIFTPPTVS